MSDPSDQDSKARDQKILDILAAAPDLAPRLTSRPQIRGGDVLRGVDQIALDQLAGKATGDLVQLVLPPLARIIAQSAFRSAERRLDHSVTLR